MIIASIFAIVICCILTNNYCTLNNAWTEDNCQKFMATLTVIPAITTFFGVKLWFMRHKLSPITARVITTIGSCTFGIYLFEQIYRGRTVWLYDILYPTLHSYPACVVWIMFACFVGFVVTLILKKVPVLKKIL